MEINQPKMKNLASSKILYQIKLVLIAWKMNIPIPESRVLVRSTCWMKLSSISYNNTWDESAECWICYLICRQKLMKFLNLQKP